MVSVTLYKPNDQPKLYPDVTNVNIEQGVLTFHIKSTSFNPDVHIRTNVLFVISD
jgi:hypothetical protein